MDNATTTEQKIEEQTMKLMEENTLPELQQKIREMIGVEHKGRDRAKAALRLARHIVMGNGSTGAASPAAPKAKAGMTPEEEEKMACGILARVKTAWDEIDRLIEEKKTALAEFRQVIGKAKDSIANTLSDDTLGETKKLGRVEGHWRTLTRTEQKKAEVAAEMGKLIKAARQTMKSEIDNARQLTLFG